MAGANQQQSAGSILVVPVSFICWNVSFFDPAITLNSGGEIIARGICELVEELLGDKLARRANRVQQWRQFCQQHSR